MNKRNFLITLLTVIALTCICLFTACEVHTHTYSEDWSHDDDKHWHAATCEHTSLKKDEAEHEWTLVEGSTTDYECICGATKTEEPLHEHTYSEEWSHDDDKHWHAASCEHTDLKADEAEHVWTLVEGSTTDYECICGATKTEEPLHEHTYSEEWSHDDDKHWHAATCEHTDLKKDEAEHVWTLVEGSTFEYECICGATKTRIEAENSAMGGTVRRQFNVATGVIASYFQYYGTVQTKLVLGFVAEEAMDNVTLALNIANQQEHGYDTYKEHDLSEYSFLYVNGVNYTVNGDLKPWDSDWFDFNDYYATISVQKGFNEITLVYEKEEWQTKQFRLAFDYLEIYAPVEVGTIYEAEYATDKKISGTESNCDPHHTSGDTHVCLFNSDDYVVWDVESAEDREATVYLYLATRALSDWNDAFDLDLSTQNIFYIVDAEGNKTLIKLEGELYNAVWLDFATIKATVNLKAGTNHLRLEVASVREDGTTQNVKVQCDCIVVF